MAYAFKAKPSFGTLIEPLGQGEYISRKKSNKLNDNSYERYLFLKKGRYVNNRFIPVNKSNLIAGLYYKMNLNNVCVIVDELGTCDNVKIDVNSEEPFFQTDTIDPLGALFGNSECGVNNFTHYMEPICSTI